MAVKSNILQKSTVFTPEALARLSAEAEHLGQEKLTNPLSVAEMVRTCVGAYPFKASAELYEKHLEAIRQSITEAGGGE